MTTRSKRDDAADAAAVRAELVRSRRLLWGIAYRMTGSAADADDVVQDTCERALRRPPSSDRSLVPWLATVCMNAARDRLRRRRRTAYVGPWLPEPVPDEALDALDADTTLGALRRDEDAVRDPERAVLLRESVSLAFLCALERLTPLRRAVLLLRDVFDCSTADTADVLGISGDAVKQALARARRTLAEDPALAVDTRARHGQNAEAVVRFLGALAVDDEATVRALLAKDVRGRSDGGGAYFAARRELVGAEEVARVYRRLGRLAGAAPVPTLVEVNGQRAVLLRFHGGEQRAGVAPLTLIVAETDAQGRICAVLSFLAPAKLARVALSHGGG